MRKLKKLIVSTSTLSLIAAAATPVITSCSTKGVTQFDEALIKDLKNETISQFMALTPVAPHYSNVGDPGDGHNLKAIKNYYKNLVTEMGLVWHEQPDGEGYEGNAYFDIPASDDGKDMKPIILQAHMDMVYANTDKQIDKHNVTIELVDEVVNGERVIHSKNYKTSIGADDGIGIAIILSLAKNRTKVKHGLIRCLFTTDEEPGLIGAENIPHEDTENWFRIKPEDKTSNTIDYLLNLDNEDLKTLVIASMGGSNNNVSLKLKNDGTHNYVIPTTGLNNIKYLEFKASDFKGGHSGTEFNNGKANPFSILVSALDDIRLLDEQIYNSFHLVDISSPTDCVSNKIPQGGSITFAIDSTKTKEEIQAQIDSLQEHFDKLISMKYPAETSAKLEFTLKEDNLPNKVIATAESHNIAGFIDHLDTGIFIPETVDGYHTTSNYAPINLKIDETSDELKFNISIYARSYSSDILEYLWSTITDDTIRYFLPYGESSVTYEQIAYYDPWYPASGTNKLENITLDAYKFIGNNNPQKVLIAGGLELSWWYRYNKGMNLATIGPELVDPHDVKEIVKVDSIDKVIKMTLYIITNI